MNGLPEAARADAELGRMTAPVDITDDVPQRVLLHPRFGVEQTKEDVTIKLRPVDQLSWVPCGFLENPSKKEAKRDSANGYSTSQEKIRLDTLENFIGVLQTFVSSVGCIPGLFKAGSRIVFSVLQS